MKTLAIAAATFGFVVTAAPALAGPEKETTHSVSVAGLDLATPEGQKLLEGRIDRVAKQVCGMSEVRTGTRMRSTEARKCLKKARASAKKQVAAMIADQQRGG